MSKSRLFIALSFAVSAAAIVYATGTRPQDTARPAAANAPFKLSSLTLSDKLSAKMKDLYGMGAPKDIVFEKVSVKDIEEIRRTMPKVAQPQIIQPGDTAVGTVIEESTDQVYVDSSPCNGRLMTFTQPYTKTPTKEVTCGGKALAVFKFVQGKAP